MANPLENYPAHDNSSPIASRFKNFVKPNPKTLDFINYSEKGVSFHQELYTMENDTSYIVTFSELDERTKRPASNIVSLEHSAWLTKFGGLNERRQLALGQHFGIPSIFIGVQQSKQRKGNLIHTARDGLAIRAHVGERLGHDAVATLTGGISRGAMLADITESIAYQHGLNSIYKDSLVSCQANRLSYTKTARRIFSGPKNEFSAFRSLKVPLSILWRYKDTFDGSMRDIAQQSKEIKALTSGHISRVVDAHPNKESLFGYSLVFDGDILSHGEEFVELYSNHPYEHVDLIEQGGHFSCASEGTYAQWKERIGTISNILHENPAVAHMGAAAFYSLAVEQDPHFAKDYGTAA